MYIEGVKRQIEKNPFSILSEVVYEELFHDIINLELQPDDKVNENQIAIELGISRTPVNQALQRLLSEGLLVKRSSRRLCVAPMKKSECRELYESRLAIEGYAAYLCTKMATPQIIKQLEDSIRYFRTTVMTTMENQADADAAFHQIIVRSTRNRYLEQMYMTTENFLLRYRNLLTHKLPPERLRPILIESCNSHQAILNAIKLGFSDIARNEMERHISTMIDALLEWDWT